MAHNKQINAMGANPKAHAPRLRHRVHGMPAAAIANIRQLRHAEAPALQPAAIPYINADQAAAAIANVRQIGHAQRPMPQDKVILSEEAILHQQAHGGAPYVDEEEATGTLVDLNKIAEDKAANERHTAMIENIRARGSIILPSSNLATTTHTSSPQVTISAEKAALTAEYEATEKIFEQIKALEKLHTEINSNSTKINQLRADLDSINSLGAIQITSALSSAPEEIEKQISALENANLSLAAEMSAIPTLKESVRDLPKLYTIRKMNYYDRLNKL